MLAWLSAASHCSAIGCLEFSRCGNVERRLFGTSIQSLSLPGHNVIIVQGEYWKCCNWFEVEAIICEIQMRWKGLFKVWNPRTFETLIFLHLRCSWSKCACQVPCYYPKMAKTWLRKFYNATGIASQLLCQILLKVIFRSLCQLWGSPTHVGCRPCWKQASHLRNPGKDRIWACCDECRRVTSQFGKRLIRHTLSGISRAKHLKYFKAGKTVPIPTNTL